jgi:hypothetical protein
MPGDEKARPRILAGPMLWSIACDSLPSITRAFHPFLVGTRGLVVRLPSSEAPKRLIIHATRDNGQLIADHPCCAFPPATPAASPPVARKTCAPDRTFC